MLINICGNYINPDHITHVTPICNANAFTDTTPQYAYFISFTIHFTGRPSIQINSDLCQVSDDATTRYNKEKVLEKIYIKFINLWLKHLSSTIHYCN